VTPALTQKLRSGDEVQVRAALDEVRLAAKGAQAAAPAVSEALQRGLSAPLTEAALDTLADVEAESASLSVATYAKHRNPAVRRAAVKALAKTKGAVATKTLRHALSDSDAMVRGFAATGLGALKAKEAVPDLFVALDHKVPEAAAAIGQVCAPAECDQLAAKLGRLPFDVVTGGLDQVLFRPAAEVSDDQKVKLVGKLRELGTQEAHKYLSDVQKRWPETWSSRVKQSIDQAVIATSGGSK
jgi:HEAT repeat protein